MGKTNEEKNSPVCLFVTCVCVYTNTHAQSCLTLCNSMDYRPPDFSIHEIFQASQLECIAISSSRRSSRPRNRTLISCISCIGRQILYHLRHLGSPSKNNAKVSICLLWSIPGSISGQTIIDDQVLFRVWVFCSLVRCLWIQSPMYFISSRKDIFPRRNWRWSFSKIPIISHRKHLYFEPGFIIAW